MLNGRFKLLSAILIGALASQAQAVSLAPGETVATNGTTPVPVGAPALPIGSQTSATVSLGGSFSATLNTLALINGNGVAFLYQITNNATSSTDIIGSVELNFVSYTTDVDYSNSDPDGAGGFFTNGTVASTTATRSSGSGSSITFEFGNGGIGAGQTSEVFFIQTNAPLTQLVNITLQGADGTTAGSISIGPTGEPVPVPEPSMLQAIAFSALPLFGLARIVRRRRQPATETC